MRVSPSRRCLLTAVPQSCKPGSGAMRPYTSCVGKTRVTLSPPLTSGKCSESGRKRWQLLERPPRSNTGQGSSSSGRSLARTRFRLLPLGEKPRTPPKPQMKRRLLARRRMSGRNDIETKRETSGKLSKAALEVPHQTPEPLSNSCFTVSISVSSSPEQSMCDP
jgi:hypothetical protein